MKLSRLVNSLPKRLFAGFLLALAVMLPVASSAASTVKIESSMGVANVTKGDTTYAASVNATYNQVVKLQVYYHNTELPDSGKVAQNLRVKINVPSTPGKVQKQTATVSADNSNTVNSSTTVNLDDASEYLQYIPGSAVWRHNTGTNDNVTEVNTTISDSVVTSGTGVVLENEKPCYNFAGTVTVLARVMIPGTKVVKEVEKADQTNMWSQSNTANAGDTLKYRITYQNTGNTQAQNVIVRDNLPADMTLVPNTTYVYSSIANGVLDKSNNITGGGLNVGNPLPGAVVYVTLEAKVPGADKLSCGVNTFRNIGIAHPKTENEYYNVAVTTVNKTCVPTPPAPVYTCDLLTLGKSDNRTVKATVSYTAKNGATYKSTSFNWGDNSTATSGSATTASHSYAKDGTYNVVATVSFTVNGVTKTATSVKCAQPVTFKSTPSNPVYSCDLLSFSQGDNRSVTASVAYTAQNGATLKTVTFDWGDNSTPLTTSNTTASYQYAKDGTYTITAKILFSVNGKDVFATSAQCAQPVTFTTTPPSTPPVLPNTGAGNVIGIALGAVVAGTIAGRLFLSRKLARQ